MAIYNITETRPAILRWEYTVFAQDEESALEQVMSGRIEADQYFTDEDPFSDPEFDVEEKVASSESK